MLQSYITHACLILSKQLFMYSSRYPGSALRILQTRSSRGHQQKPVSPAVNHPQPASPACLPTQCWPGDKGASLWHTLGRIEILIIEELVILKSGAITCPRASERMQPCLLLSGDGTQWEGAERWNCFHQSSSEAERVSDQQLWITQCLH